MRHQAQPNKNWLRNTKGCSKTTIWYPEYILTLQKETVTRNWGTQRCTQWGSKIWTFKYMITYCTFSAPVIKCLDHSNTRVFVWIALCLLITNPQFEWSMADHSNSGPVMEGQKTDRREMAAIYVVKLYFVRYLNTRYRPKMTIWIPKSSSIQILTVPGSFPSWILAVSSC
jgi:hypothetical protein